MADIPPPPPPPPDQPPGQIPPPPSGPPPGGPPQPFQPAYPQPYPYGQPGVLPEAQGATTSMVLGIVAVVLSLVGCDCWFIEIAAVPLGIVAIVMGVNARNRINASGGTLGGRGKAMAAIIMGAVAVAIGAIAVVIGLAFAGLNASGVLQNLIPTPTPS